jgi:hypothetical protein
MAERDIRHASALLAEIELAVSDLLRAKAVYAGAEAAYLVHGAGDQTILPP